MAPAEMGETQMTKWTTQNTEGFTADELATMNAAQAALEVANPGIDVGNIADLLNNEFLPGITDDALVAAVQARLS